MAITLWRLIRTVFEETAFDGSGAKANPGRWNLEGIPVVYSACSASLAVLEVMVGLDHVSSIEGFAFLPARIDESLIEALAAEALPADWQSIPASLSTRNLGTAWAQSRRSVALAVPSAVLPLETVYLLNPEHPAFASVAIGRPIPFSLDPRLRC